MKIQVCKSMLIPMLLVSLAVLFGGCEDEPSTNALDNYFANNPYLSDPRLNTTDPAISLEPDRATINYVGQEVSFRVRGGDSHYSWDVSRPGSGSITPSRSNGEMAVYKAFAVSENDVIVYDRHGNAAVAVIEVGDTGTLKLTPASVTIEGNNIAGLTVQFTVSGGEPPYHSWQVAYASMGTIDQNGLYTVVGNSYGDNFVSVQDAAGNLVEATVTQKAGEEGAMRVEPETQSLSGTLNSFISAQQVQFVVIGGTRFAEPDPPYQVTTSGSFGSIQSVTRTTTGATVTYATQAGLTIDGSDTITIVDSTGNSVTTTVVIDITDN